MDQLELYDFHGNIILPSAWPELARPGFHFSVGLAGDNGPSVVVHRSPRSEVRVFPTDANISPHASPQLRARSSPRASSAIRHSRGPSDGELDSGPGDYDAESVILDEPGVVDDQDRLMRAGFDPRSCEGKLLRMVVPIPPDLDACSRASTPEQMRKRARHKATWPSSPIPSKDPSTRPLEVILARVTGDEHRNIQIVADIGPQKDAPTDQGHADWQWLHMEQDVLDVSTFRNYVLATPGISDIHREVVERLFETITKERMHNYVDGRFIEPGTVLRADAQSNDTAQGASATFVSFPFIDIHPGPGVTEGQSRAPLGQHPPRSLLQTYWPQISQAQDRQDSLRARWDLPKSDMVFVPQLWAVILGEDFLVTAGRIPSHELMGDAVRVDGVVEPAIQVKREGKLLLALHPPAFDSILRMQKTMTTQLMVDRANMPAQSTKSLYAAYASAKPRLHEMSVTLNPPEPPPPGGNEYAPLESSADVVFQSGAGAVLTELDITVPPFLCWTTPDATSRQGQRRWQTAVDRAAGPVSEAANIDKHVQRIEEAIQSRDHRLRGRVRHEIWTKMTRPGWYRNVEPKSEAEVSAMIPLANLNLNRQADPPPAVLDSGHPAYWESKCRRANRGIIDELQVKLSLNFQHLGKEVEKWMAYFVPTELNDKDLFRRLRGQTFAMGEVVCASQADAPKGDSNSPWVVSDTAGSMPDEASGRPALSLPSEAIDATRTTFDRPEKAVQYLRTLIASQSQRPSTEAPARKRSVVPTDDDLAGHVCDSRSFGQRKLLECLNKLVDVCVETMESVNSLCQMIRYAVADRDGHKCERFKYTNYFLHSFKLVFRFASMATYMAQYLREAPASGRADKKAFVDEGFSVLAKVRAGAEQALLSAKAQLLRMLEPPKFADLAESISLGPHFTLVWLLRRLAVRRVASRTASIRPTDLYKEFVQAMQYQANHYPRKRLIRDIHLLEEEIAALQHVNRLQTTAIWDFATAADEHLEPLPNFRRELRYSYERNLYDSLLSHLRAENEEYTFRKGECPPMIDRTSQSIDIGENDSNKAIFVFTLVTVIFLPLSFVTSYLGMNTEDIRDTDATQDLFWEIALPLTAGIMIVLFWVAYRAESFRIWFSMLLHPRRERPSLSYPAIKIQAQATRPRPVKGRRSSEGGRLSNAGLEGLQYDEEEEAEFEFPFQPDTPLRSRSGLERYMYGSGPAVRGARGDFRDYEPYAAPPAGREMQMYDEAYYPPPPPPPRRARPPPMQTEGMGYGTYQGMRMRQPFPEAPPAW